MEIFSQQRIHGFINYLRQEGHKIGIAELRDALSIVSAQSLPDEQLTRYALRNLCCSSQQEWQSFDKRFNHYWFADSNKTASDDPFLRKRAGLSTKPQGGISGLAGTSTDHFESMANTESGGAGKQNTITKADFRFLNDNQAMRIAEELAEKLAEQLKSRTRHLHKLRAYGRSIDLRHTIRNNLSNGGVPIRPVYKIKFRKPPHLVILHDVSHSMSWNNPLLFRFARGLTRACHDSEAFVFHTKLFCVSDLYREKSIQHMRDKLEAKNHLWLGGTCIAESLKMFNKTYARKILRSDSIIIIVSDGFDTDAPEFLHRELRALRRRAKQILWLNPMLGREGYVPNTESMLAAKPFIDHFAPAHSVDALRRVVYQIRT